MKTKQQPSLLFLILLFTQTVCLSYSSFAQGTAFTYQGRLNSGSSPAGGSYDLRFAVYDASGAGTLLAGPLTNSAVAVSNGLFVATVDFGTGVFTGGSNWLEIAVRTNGGGVFNTLAPRQQLTPTPYAIFAGNASNLLGVLPASQLSGTIPNGSLPASPVFLGAVAASSFAGNGANVTNVNAATLNGLSAGNFWQLGGNNISGGQFLGSTNNQPVELWANGVRVLRLEPDSRGLNAGNVIGGFTGNAVQQPGSGGNVIAGGGVGSAANMIYTNSSGDFIGAGLANQVGPGASNAVVVGGYGNLIGPEGLGGSASSSVIVGGISNTIDEIDSVIGGGEQNFITALADHSVIAGGGFNVIRGSYSLPVYGVIGGGYQNIILTNTETANINGGYQNTNGGSFSLIGGGFQNQVLTNATIATIGGGAYNIGGSFGSTIGGGEYNHITNNANYETIGGGYINSVMGFAGTVPGGRENVAGVYSLAAGFDAQATNTGSFVWADFSGFEVPFGSLKDNSFSVRAYGGVRFVTAGAGMTLDGQPVLVSGPGSGLTLQPNSAGAPNVIGGASVNNVANGVVGGTIGGGGATNYNYYAVYRYTNAVTGDFGTVAGGANNTSADYSSVGGGIDNAASGNAATVGGGDTNTASGYYEPTVAGGYNNTASGYYYATVGGGAGNTASGSFSTVAGGNANTAGANSYYSTVGGGNGNTASGDYSTVSGGDINTASGVGAFVGGGGADDSVYSGNQAAGKISVVGGGLGNSIAASGYGATIGGGQYNTNNGNIGTIGGGQNNSIFQSAGTVYQATIGGGYGNLATNSYATVPGGINNLAGGWSSFAAGQRAKAIHQGAFVWADSQALDFTSATNDQFSVRAQGGVRFVTGGTGVTIDGQPVITVNPSYSSVVGGFNNTNQGSYSTIAGGTFNQIPAYNFPASSFIGGGDYNIIWDSDDVIGGGNQNTIGLTAGDSVIGGGTGNNIQYHSSYSVIGGGLYNSTINSGEFLVIGGGAQNTNGGNYATLSGGQLNLVTNSYATVPGGSNNVAGGLYSFAAGQQARAVQQGTFVWADSQNAPFSSTASDQFLIRARGGVGINTASTPDSNFSINTNTYLFSHAIYLRGETGSDHNHGLAYSGSTVTNFGNGNAQVDGPVLWGFSGGVLGTASGGQKPILTWNNGGVAINTNGTGGASLYVQGSRTGPFGNAVGIFENTNKAVNNAPALRVVNQGGTNLDGALSVSANVSPGTPNGLIAEFGNSLQYVVTITNDGTIYSKGVALTSDRNAKENFTVLDARLVLAKVTAMPVTEWNYKDDGAGKKHIGPVAQDFQVAFGLNGGDDTHISVVDEGGVALAAIQGLNQKVDEKEARIQEQASRIRNQSAEIRQLQQSVAELKAMVSRLIPSKSN